MIDVKKAAEAAVGYASQCGISLDYSRESITVVDDILGAYHEHLNEYGGEDGEKTLWSIAVYFGIYVGEVLLKNGLAKQGYEWYQYGDENYPVLKLDKNEFSPVTKAHKLIHNGSEDSLAGFSDVVFSVAAGDFDTPKNRMLRVCDVETSRGFKASQVRLSDTEQFVDAVADGIEDFVIFSCLDGFLQFYGTDDSFVAEARVNYADGDFQAVRFTDPDIERTERVDLITKWGKFTPRECDIITKDRLITIIEAYYRDPFWDDFLKEVNFADVTDEFK